MWGDRERRARAQAESLHRSVAIASREPALYGEGRVPDTVDGRFEMLTLHACAMMIRLKGEDRLLARAFAERVFQGLDESLRELGVGDMSLPRRLRRMAEAFYGRLKAYEAALAPDAAPGALEQALARNVWNGEAASFAAELGGRMRTLRAALAQLRLEELSEPERWLDPDGAEAGSRV